MKNDDLKKLEIIHEFPLKCRSDNGIQRVIDDFYEYAIAGDAKTDNKLFRKYREGKDRREYGGVAYEEGFVVICYALDCSDNETQIALRDGRADPDINREIREPVILKQIEDYEIKLDELTPKKGSRSEIEKMYIREIGTVPRYNRVSSRGYEVVVVPRMDRFSHLLSMADSLEINSEREDIKELHLDQFNLEDQKEILTKYLEEQGVLSAKREKWNVTEDKSIKVTWVPVY